MKPLDELESKQKIEIEYWKNSDAESPESNSILNTINKATDATNFIDCLTRFNDELPSQGKVLELGGGQCWASCIYKRLFPDTHVTATDISPFAIGSLSKWENIYEVKLDASYACKSYETQEASASIDLIFCFASAHHFLAHRKTLAEISRVLKPGGRAIYLNEPTSPLLYYPIAVKRLNRSRPEVPEDLLVVSKLRKIAHQNSLDVRVDYHPSTIRRGPHKLIHVISIIRDSIPLLQRLMPSTANIVFTRAQ